jgi:hypothetical protein
MTDSSVSAYVKAQDQESNKSNSRGRPDEAANGVLDQLLNNDLT